MILYVILDLSFYFIISLFNNFTYLIILFFISKLLKEVVCYNLEIDIILRK